MENKERRWRGREHAKAVVLGAGETEIGVALLGLISAGRTGSVADFVIELVLLALAIFFTVFRHPVFGIIFTALYGLGRVVVVMAMMVIAYFAPGDYGTAVAGLGLLWLVPGVGLVVALLGFFIYADCQAVKLRWLEEYEE